MASCRDRRTFSNSGFFLQQSIYGQTPDERKVERPLKRRKRVRSTFLTNKQPFQSLDGPKFLFSPRGGFSSSSSSSFRLKFLLDLSGIDPANPQTQTETPPIPEKSARPQLPWNSKASLFFLLQWPIRQPPLSSQKAVSVYVCCGVGGDPFFLPPRTNVAVTQAPAPLISILGEGAQ